MLPSNSTDNLLNSFPMFGHPGISALEYAGQVEKKRLSEVLLERTPTTNMPDQNTTAPTTTETELEAGELSPPLHFIDEFGCQQRRRGTFINHTPRNLRYDRASQWKFTGLQEPRVKTILAHYLDKVVGRAQVLLSQASTVIVHRPIPEPWSIGQHSTMMM
jgi:hypothetical protein